MLTSGRPFTGTDRRQWLPLPRAVGQHLEIGLKALEKLKSQEWERAADSMSSAIARDCDRRRMMAGSPISQLRLSTLATVPVRITREKKREAIEHEWAITERD